MEEVGETIRPFLDMDNSTSCENSSTENSTGEENDSEINYKNQSQKQVCTYFSDKKKYYFSLSIHGTRLFGTFCNIF